MASAPTIGIDVGGTKIAAAVVDGDGAILARRTVPTESDEPNAIVAAIVKVGREMKAAAPAVRAAGVGAAALVDHDAGRILWAPNLAYKDLDLRDLLEARLDVPVAVDNDANVAALAEAVHGAGAGTSYQVTVTVGTGIGAGIVLDGRLYRGAHGLGGEPGHMVIVPDGPQCACGNRGCWEAVASGRALGRLGRERIEGGAGAEILASVAGDLDAITGELIGDASVAGDPFARDVVASIARFLGIGLANLVNILDPELIVVGGGAAAGMGDILLDPARAAMLDHIVGVSWRPEVPLVPASLGADSGVVGAAILARERL